MSDDAATTSPTSSDVPSPSSWPRERRTTIRDLQKAKERGERWTMLTSYDALTAALFEEAGARVLLVGDSAANVVYGYDTTVPVSLDELLPLAAGVVRGTRTALVVGDLPFGSYQSSPQHALASAIRYLKEAQVHAVKLEGGAAVVPHVQLLTEAGVPVMGHLGMTPQRVHAFGGVQFVQGRGDAGEQVLADAKGLEEAGAFAVVLEAVPADLGERVSKELAIPVIGIGAGPSCDAQVMVWQDLVGLTTGRAPRFVKRYADVHGTMLGAVSSFVTDVTSGAYPDESHSYH